MGRFCLVGLETKARYYGILSSNTIPFSWSCQVLVDVSTCNNISFIFRIVTHGSCRFRITTQVSDMFRIMI